MDAAIGAAPVPGLAAQPIPPSRRAIRLRVLAVGLSLALALTAIAGQLVRLAVSRLGEDTRAAAAQPLTDTQARPDIVDRNGRLIATDVTANSLFADPMLILDLDEVIEKLAATLGGLDLDSLRPALRDQTRRFVWIRRGLTPLEAQRVHDLGLPGLAFRREPKRVYPGGELVGHIVGQVNPDNKGIAGIELHIDTKHGTEAVQGAAHSRARAVRLSLDLGVQHAVSDELEQASERYKAEGAAGLVMDADSGEIIAAASWPKIDPNVAGASLDKGRPDRLQGGVYELGSIFKALTAAMLLEDGLATLDTSYDVTKPLQFGRHSIRDLHAAGRPLSVREVFVRSSNVGSAMMALQAGTSRQLVFLARMGLLEPLRTEAGPIAPPLLPSRWEDVETATIGFGHGLAVAPLQFAAAAAALVNGGWRVQPSFITQNAGDAATSGSKAQGQRILAAKTSRDLRELFRLNVTMASGTGRRANVPGYRVGGKTGTAELPAKGGYQAREVITTFLGAFPMDKPRYLLMISLFQPKSGDGAAGEITAGLNAAPLTAAIVRRVAPILGVLPRRLAATP